MNSCFRYFLLVLVLVVFRGFGQTAAPSPQQASAQAATTQSAAAKVEMPSDPAALLELAAKKNGLQNAETEPLHIKPTYQVIDDKGAVAETGTFEQFRFSAKKYKLIYSSPSFNRTDYLTDVGLFRVGDARPDPRVSAVWNVLYPWFPSSEVVAESKLGFEVRNAGTTTLKCVSMDPAKAEQVAYHNVFCFSPSAPILRIEQTNGGAAETVYNNIISVQGTFTGRDVSISQGKTRLRVHIDLLDAQPQIDEGILSPPPGATLIPFRARVGAAVMAGRLVHKVRPAYPEMAKTGRVQGTIALQATIGKDGSIVDLQFISGPTVLTQAAMEAVRQWRYEPYLLDGVPVEVGTEIDVVFTLN